VTSSRLSMPPRTRSSHIAVAERLMPSVRTVESHIYRGMAKTGVTSPDELAALIPGCESIARD
jgi:DNA-binding CsgD family transcriptional regulator